MSEHLAPRLGAAEARPSARFSSWPAAPGRSATQLLPEHIPGRGGRFRAGQRAEKAAWVFSGGLWSRAIGPAESAIASRSD